MTSPAIVHLNQEAVAQQLPWRELVDALQAMFCGQCTVPDRHHHTINIANQPDATLLLMPAWIDGQYLGVKLANVFPGNRQQGLPSIAAHYLLSSANTGQLLASLDGGELTARRTAAASVLAASYLAPQNTRRHLMIGTGRLSINLIQAYAATLSIKEFSIWGINNDHAEQIAEKLKGLGLSVTAVALSQLDAAVAAADIISCATLSHQPLIKGAAVKPGTHIDLVGSFTPAMREADDQTIKKAAIYIDTAMAIKESGDLIDPINRGLLSVDAIQADLYELCRKQHSGRQAEHEITLFKSVGAACEDLAAAALAYESHQRMAQQAGSHHAH